MTKPKVFIVEDEEGHIAAYRGALPDTVEIIVATSLDEARELFPVHAAGIALIILDGDVPKSPEDAITSSFTTLPLATEFRESFTGPMIAATSSALSQHRLRKAGCHYPCDKKDVPGKAMELLLPILAAANARPGDTASTASPAKLPGQDQARGH